MQNRFGLKDFILLFVMILTLASIWMAMAQDDRRWKQNSEILSKLASLEQQGARLDQQLRAGVELSPKSIDKLSSSISNAIGNTLSETIAKAGPIVVTQNDNDQGSKNTSEHTGANDTNTTSDSHDTSWARPGVPIEWQPKYTFATDPRNEPDFAYGGELTEAYNAQPSKLMPVLGEDVYSTRIVDQVCETLGDYDPKTLKMRGLLAQAWQYDPNGMWLRVKIRDEARFSDGQPVTAEDVKWTLDEYINNPEMETEALRSLLTQIKDAQVISDKVIEFHFTEPGAYNLRNALGIYALPKHFYSKFTTTELNKATGLVMGSGPFKLKSLDPDHQWTPGEDAVLVRNELYWGDRSPLASLRYRTITSDQARLVAYENKEVDMIGPTSPQFIEVPKRYKEQGKDIHDTTYTLKWVNMKSGYSFIGWQCGKRNGKYTPFHDKRVRQAMTYLLDRQRMIDDIWGGIGEVAVGPNNPPKPTADPTIKPYPYDLAKAKKLLAEAGWIDRDGDGILENEEGDEFEFEFTRSSGSQISERIGKFVVDSCAKAGIRCIQRPVDWSIYDQILKGRDFDALIMGWSPGSPESDPTQIWSTKSIQNQGNNFIQWDAGQDAIIDKIVVELDEAKRMELFHQFARLIHEEQPYTFIRVSPWLRYISKDFKNVHPYPKSLEQREFYMPAQ